MSEYEIVYRVGRRSDPKHFIETDVISATSMINAIERARSKKIKEFGTIQIRILKAKLIYEAVKWKLPTKSENHTSQDTL